jgi:hypothetical protein
MVDHVEESKKGILAKYNHFIEENKWKPHTTEDFQNTISFKTKFDQSYTTYRDNKNTHFKSLQTNLKSI